METNDKPNNYCFNCHSELNMKDGFRPGGVVITSATATNDEQTLFSEALTYIFELDTDRMEELEGLNINEMSLCNGCHDLLANIYNFRQRFQDLTSSNSCLFSILFKFKSELEQDIDFRPPPHHDHFDEQEQMEFLNSEGAQVMDIDPLDMVQIKTEIGHAGDEEEIVTTNSPTCQSPGGPRRSLRVHRTSAQEAPKSLISRTRVIAVPERTACPECGKSIKSRSLSCHIARVHRGQMLFKCDICQKPFHTDRTALLVHRATHLSEEERLALKPEELGLQLQRRKSRKMLFCDICQKPFQTDRTALLVHRSTHFSETERLALKPDEQKALKQLHERMAESLTKKFLRDKQIPMSKGKKKREKSSAICPECGKQFYGINTPTTLREHINIVHRNTSRHICEICAKPMQSDHALKIHRPSHMNAEERAALEGGSKSRLLCDECGKSCKDAACLKAHIKLVHEKVPKRVYSCDKCGHSTTGSQTHKRHLRAHEIEKDDQYFYSCDKCPMKFKFKMERRYHGPVCPGEAAQRPHQCQEEGCGKRFKYRHSLELHLNETHKFGPERAREIVLPGLPLPKFQVRKLMGKRNEESAE